MSNMKELLGDTTFEEFEVKRKLVLDNVDRFRNNDTDAPWNDYNQILDIWLELEGMEFAQKWIKYNGSDGLINREQAIVLAKELAVKFIKWLEESI